MAGALARSVAPQAGDAIDLASNNTVRFVDVGSTAPGAAHLSGSAIGTLTLNNVNLGTLPSATGRRLALSNGSFSAPSVTLATLNSTGSSGGAAVSLTNLTGTLQINAGSVSNATGGAVLAVAGGTLSLSAGGSVSQASNQPLVSVSADTPARSASRAA